MKMFMKILVFVAVIAVLIAIVPFHNTCKSLQKDVLRLHILANSDSDFDQKMKLDVRDTVLKESSCLYNCVKTKEEALSVTKDNLYFIQKTAQQTVDKYGCNYDVKVKLNNIYFDTRYYEDFTMPAGYYDTLQIEIGSAQGKNWWCVMYPTLCVGASTSQSMKEDLSQNEYDVVTTEKFVFRFKIVECYEKFISLFR